MSTMRKRTSLYKNNQALKKMAEKGVPYVEKTHTGRLFYAKRVSYNSNPNLNLNIDNVIFSSPDRDIAGWNRNLH